jgi:hypothetical protein
MRRSTVFAIALSLGLAGEALAQATGTPSYNAPYRAFTRSEFGAVLSFPSYDAGTAVEGVYRFASGQFDVGLKGGLFFPDGGGDTEFLVGVEGRYRVLTHNADFPLDGALIFGGGLQLNAGTSFILPVGLSLGRRLQVENSQVSIVPYLQPTLFIVSVDTGVGRNTDAQFGLGIGGDFRLSRRFDARLSIGVGDLDGIAIGAVWIH